MSRTAKSHPPLPFWLCADKGFRRDTVGLELSGFRPAQPVLVKPGQIIVMAAGCLAMLGGWGMALTVPLAPRPPRTELAPGIFYTNYWFPNFPWLIHVARLDRRGGFAFHSIHAYDRVCGLSPASELAEIARRWGEPVAVLNGDFFQVEHFGAGDPRGLQIVEGNLLSGPSGRAVFWVDDSGQPHLDQVWPDFWIHFPDGSVKPFRLNEELHSNRLVLYTPDYGFSTGTTNVRNVTELVLEPFTSEPGVLLRAGQTIQAWVREAGKFGDSMLEPGLLVLAAGPKVDISGVEAGMLLEISTATRPDLSRARAAIGGGPILLKDGKIVPLPKPPFKKRRKMSNEIRAWWERHPRTALGWNADSWYLVVVEGRWNGISAGMTLDELAVFMRKRLGCTDAINLDGGGSSTLWLNGQVRNYPSDGVERKIANGLVIVRPK